MTFKPHKCDLRQKYHLANEGARCAKACTVRGLKENGERMIQPWPVPVAMVTDAVLIRALKSIVIEVVNAARDWSPFSYDMQR